jgi:spore germination protein KB
MTVCEDKDKISGMQMMAILVMIRIVPISIMFPMITGAKQPQDTVIGSVLSALLSIPPILLITYMSNKFPGKTIIEYSLIILGKFLGSLLSLALIWYWLHGAANSLRQLAEAYAGVVMPETPMLAFVIIMAVVSAYAAKGGIEVIGRVGELTLAIVILAASFTIVLPYPLIDFDNLSPMLAEGWGTVIESSMTSLAFYMQFIIIGMIVPYLDKPSCAAKFSLYALIVCTLLMTTFIISLVGVFGGTSNSFIYPAYNLTRMISIAQFIERVEAVVLTVWVFSVAISVAIQIWAAAHGLEEIIKWLRLKGLVWHLSAICAAMSIVFYKSVIELELFYEAKNWGVYSLSVTLGSLSLIFIVALFRGMLNEGSKR